MSATETQPPTTQQNVERAGRPGAPRQNPKDSMKSTWRTWDRKDWSFFHWPYEILYIHHSDLGREVPKFEKSAPVPHLPSWTEHRWVLFHSAIPLLLQQAYISYTGNQLSSVAMCILYAIAFKGIVIHEFNVLRRLSYKYGYFDGDKHERDGVPDHAVWSVLNSLMGTSTLRTIMTVMLTYNHEGPMTITWKWLPLMIGFYGLVLDFWFYWYHRLMHDVASLWQHHRTHHLTKHPNPLLTLYADHEQEFMDIIGIPLLTYLTMRFAMGLNMNFYDWWLCHQYVVFAEIAGHSGLRIHSTTPSTFTPIYNATGTELVIEDHDLHHRYGWKHSFNYGKQTRVWDKIFGTTRERIEAQEPNVDRVNQVHFPLF